MDSRKKLFEILVEIKDDINAQIPLATNRFEEFECAPADADQDEIDRLYFIHEQKLFIASREFHIYSHINEVAAKYLHERDSSCAAAMRDDERDDLKQRLLSQGAILCQKWARTHQVLKSDVYIDFSETEKQLRIAVEENFERICKGEALEIADKDLNERFKKDLRLVDHREICDRQLGSNSQLLIGEAFDLKKRELIEKASIIWRGVYFDGVNSDVGFCDEHACIGLKRIFEQTHLIYEDVVSIEKVSISYEEGDGHTFLVINRDPNSRLSDISGWGKDAILFDPWNKLVCYAEDYSSLPIYYFSYPDAAEWESIKFEMSDCGLISTISTIDNYFSITENSDIDHRLPVLMEEYQLTSLDGDEYAKTRDFLYALVRAVTPDNFSVNVEVFITNAGNKLITSISGFSVPVIAIHRDFINQVIQGRVISVEELKFGLAHIVHKIKAYGVGLSDDIDANEQHQLDKKSLKTCKSSEAAISFLRKSIEFSSREHHEVKMVNMLDRNYRITQASYEQRIKNIMTMLASNEEFQDNNTVTPIPDDVRNEMASIPEYQFFSDQYKRCQNNIEKLQYLISCLPSLMIELLPFEFTQKPSVRVREFCALLREINIDFSDLDQSALVDNLVNAAYRLRIPAFEEIYLAALNVKYHNGRFLNIRQLGLFKEIQNIINEFVSADAYEAAEHAANRFITLFEEYKNHFQYLRLHNPAYQHLLKYKREHNGAFPVKSERLFCSEIGRHIVWQGFADAIDNIVPWDKHVNWAVEHASLPIARMLWRLGVNRDQRYWSVFSGKELLENINGDDIISSPIEKIKQDRIIKLDCHHQALVLQYLSSQHKLDTSMFDTGAHTFEDAFKLFYDNNHVALMHPDLYGENHNTDNEAVNYLLNKFAEVSIDGVEEDKQVVKGFFLGRQDGRDFKHLCHVVPGIFRFSSDNVNTPYCNFIIERRYKDRSFDLFTQEEILAAIKECNLFVNKISGKQFIGIFQLPFDDLNIPCMEQLFPLMVRYRDRWAIFNVLMEGYLSSHDKYYFLSPEAIRITKLIFEYISRAARNSLRLLKYAIPDSATLASVNHHDLVLMYRAFDMNMLFPSYEEQREFGRHLIQRIKMIANADDLILTLEQLLSTSKEKFTFSISDINLRNVVIDMWVAETAKKYGCDDSTDEYYSKMADIIDHIYENVSSRDNVILLSKLANAIKAQQKVSEHMGELIDPEKYFILNGSKKKKNDQALSMLASASKVFSNRRDEQIRLLNFLSTPISHQTVNEFAAYIVSHDKARDLHELFCSRGEWYEMNNAERMVSIESGLQLFYHMFWDRPLEERAVLIDHLLIPADRVISDTDIQQAYEEAFLYVAAKLFPSASEPGSNEEFAFSFLKTYLDTADKNIRHYLMAGILIASNESQQCSQQSSVGKKLVSLCEHMGPAYVKLAQAIHSHPRTPKSLRRDLDHIKGRANPPHRWQLWRMIIEVLPKHERDTILYMGNLLGSASYNLAIEVTLQDHRNVVLILLRENAEKDAMSGFAHIQRAVEASAYPRLAPMKPSILSIINEAKTLSSVEMNHVMSQRQYEIAQEVYQNLSVVVDAKYVVRVSPSRLYKCGNGYRFTQQVYGVEFNDLPHDTMYQRHIHKSVAKAVITVELINILSGGYFDSDRHGNQLRIHVDEVNHIIQLGLYDFGEMALDKPSKLEIGQLVQVIHALPRAIIESRSFIASFDSQLSRQIEIAHIAGQSIHYLMHVRKALLALQDFQRHLTAREFVEILVRVSKSKQIHYQFRDALKNYIRLISVSDKIYTSFKNKINHLTHFGAHNRPANSMPMDHIEGNQDSKIRDRSNKR